MSQNWKTVSISVGVKADDFREIEYISGEALRVDFITIDIAHGHSHLVKKMIEHIAKHLPADGSVWITNNTKYHNAFNGGEEDRIHLVACVLDHKFN